MSLVIRHDWGRRAYRAGLVRRNREIVTYLLDDFSSCPRQQVLVDEGIQCPVEDCLRIPGLVAGAVVLDELVRMEHIAADRFPPESRVGDAAPLLRQHGLALLLGPLHEARLE